MNITTQTRDDATAAWAQWHKLVVAEDGFSVLTAHAQQHGLDPETVVRFAAEVNERNEPSSLHPKAPISAMPRRYFREISAGEAAGVLVEFCRDIESFIAANRHGIHARRVLVDFHVSPASIFPEYLSAVSEVFSAMGAKAGIEDLVILS
jgi:hypothetical protein